MKKNAVVPWDTSDLACELFRETMAVRQISCFLGGIKCSPFSKYQYSHSSFHTVKLTFTLSLPQVFFCVCFLIYCTVKVPPQSISFMSPGLSLGGLPEFGPSHTWASWVFSSVWWIMWGEMQHTLLCRFRFFRAVIKIKFFSQIILPVISRYTCSKGEECRDAIATWLWITYPSSFSPLLLCLLFLSSPLYGPWAILQFSWNCPASHSG